ncbi:MAG: hypothetical protein ACFFDN_14990 [Candidatus Hodarchaeota archaeon]
MVLPLFYVKSNLKIPLIGVLPNIFQKPSISNDLSTIESRIEESSEQVRTQGNVEDLPISVIGNYIYYEWETFNGTGRLTWSGTTLDPLNIQISTTNEGLEIYMTFSFSTLEWGTSVTYLGYAVPI